MIRFRYWNRVPRLEEKPPCHLYMSWFSYEIGIWLGRMIPHSDFSYYCNIEFIITFAVFVLYEYCCTCSLLLQFDRAYLYLCKIQGLSNIIRLLSCKFYGFYLLHLCKFQRGLYNIIFAQILGINFYKPHRWRNG